MTHSATTILDADKTQSFPIVPVLELWNQRQQIMSATSLNITQNHPGNLSRSRQSVMYSSFQSPKLIKDKMKRGSALFPLNTLSFHFFLSKLTGSEN